MGIFGFSPDIAPKHFLTKGHSHSMWPADSGCWQWQHISHHASTFTLLRCRLSIVRSIFEHAREMKLRTFGGTFIFQIFFQWLLSLATSCGVFNPSLFLQPDGYIIICRLDRERLRFVFLPNQYIPIQITLQRDRQYFHTCPMCKEVMYFFPIPLESMGHQSGPLPSSYICCCSPRKQVDSTHHNTIWGGLIHDAHVSFSRRFGVNAELYSWVVIGPQSTTQV